MKYEKAASYFYLRVLILSHPHPATMDYRFFFLTAYLTVSSILVMIGKNNHLTVAALVAHIKHG